MAMWFEAAELADRYNWPNEARYLRWGIVPEGFGKEVGKTIVLFLERPVVGWTFTGKSQHWASEYEKEMRGHALTLARLRFMLAKLHSMSM